MNIAKIKYFVIFIFAPVAVLFLYFPIKNHKFPLSAILSHQIIIKKYCKIFNLDTRLYVSVIYGELINNYNALDNFDETRAYLGFNPSIGFAQLRVSTIKWIELNYSFLDHISQSISRKKLIGKGINDTTNILYSVLYVKLIKEKLSNINSIRSIGSYYGRGIDNGKEIDINYTNSIGDSAEAFYFSKRLTNVFKIKNNYYNVGFSTPLEIFKSNIRTFSANFQNSPRHF